MSEQTWRATGYGVPRGYGPNAWRFPKVHLAVGEKTLCGRDADPGLFATRYKVDCRVCLRVAKRSPRRVAVQRGQGRGQEETRGRSAL